MSYESEENLVGKNQKEIHQWLCTAPLLLQSKVVYQLHGMERAVKQAVFLIRHTPNFGQLW